MATFTWENARLSRKVLDEAGITIGKAILSCKPWHARRALGYYALAFPDVEFIVSPCSMIGCERNDWWKNPVGRENVMGELERCGHQLGNEIFSNSHCE